ncbi:MAG: hypothetical protein JNM88_10580 [Chitinophagaceae bacterium]|nr:hypothetical protein [Chitinophagaceae bacterium]
MKYNSFVVVIAAFVLSGCDSCKTKPDTKDKTPAAITWAIQNRTQGTTTNLTGNASYTARLGDDLMITACGEDDGGVKEIVHSSNSSYRCQAEGIAQQVGPGLVVPTTVPLGLDDQGRAWKRYCVFINMNLQFNCQAGFSFSSGNAGVSMNVTNYGNVVANAGLSINVVQ